MSLHPVYIEKLHQLHEAAAPPLSEVPVELSRQMYRTMQPERPELVVHSVEDMNIPGSAGDIPVRIYRPSNSSDLPIALMYHGGGWVIGDLTTADGQSREICRNAQAIVISVDYRLAPENKYPAAVDDCYSALEWVHENAASIGGDSSRIAVVGDSAGGNLAAVVAQKAQDEEGPSICFQLLVYPVTDGSRFDTASYKQNAYGYMLTRDAMKWFWEQYADPDDRLKASASPLLADSLKGLPPAVVLTAEYDVLRDEGEAYGNRMKEAGVDVEIVRCEGMIHGFIGETNVVEPARKAIAQACGRLSSAFAGVK